MTLQWIPTSEHLPDTARFVWITVEGDGYRLTKDGYYDYKDNQWFEASGFAMGPSFIPVAENITVTAYIEIPHCLPPYFYEEKALEGEESFLNQCGIAPKTKDVRPALKALKQACEEFCKCFCHTRDGLTICPDCEAVHNSRDYQLKCKMCGTEQVYIRGQYPGHDNRLVCPQCTQERLEDLQSASGRPAKNCE